jgi:hypothetical protein
MRKFAKRLLITVLLSVLFPSGFAYAYLDPGTGSVVLQAVIALLVLIFALIKNFWENLKNAIFKLFKIKK